MKMLRSLAIALALTALAAACASSGGPAPAASPAMTEPDTAPATDAPLLDHSPTTNSDTSESP